METYLQDTSSAECILGGRLVKASEIRKFQEDLRETAVEEAFQMLCGRYPGEIFLRGVEKQMEGII